LFVCCLLIFCHIFFAFSLSRYPLPLLTVSEFLHTFDTFLIF
jgi:hypothetical protein